MFHLDIGQRTIRGLPSRTKQGLLTRILPDALPFRCIFRLGGDDLRFRAVRHSQIAGAPHLLRRTCTRLPRLFRSDGYSFAAVRRKILLATASTDWMPRLRPGPLQPDEGARA